MTSKEITALPNTSLCAIVRDEEMNPAGGIKRFIETIVPHVEEAVVVDTGSLDRTREILEELKSEFPNLSVFDRQFDNYAASRNYSLEQIRTKRVLVLDADELITHGDFLILKEFMLKNNKAKGFFFNFSEVYPNGDILSGIAHNPRLFSMDIEPFYAIPICYYSEYLFSRKIKGEIIEENTFKNRNFYTSVLETSPIDIYHFRPSWEMLKVKERELYCSSRGATAPSTLPNFAKWKAYNPIREEFD